MIVEISWIEVFMNFIACLLLFGFVGDDIFGKYTPSSRKAKLSMLLIAVLMHEIEHQKRSGFCVYRDRR